MTALTVPTRAADAATLRPVPWRQMVWVTWRQHRFALSGVAALLGGLAVYAWIGGIQQHDAYAAAVLCQPASSPACGELILSVNDMNRLLVDGYALQAVPALIGAFVGAPLLARELETDTFRFAWTQSFGRWRWTLAKLVLLAVVVTGAAAAFSVLLSRYYQPYLTDRDQALSFSQASPLAPGLFDLRGVAFAAWTLVAFAIGALAGTVIRRVVPAIVATLAAYTGLALTAALFLREHYQTPLATTDQNVPAAAWITTQWGTKGGEVAFTGRPPVSLLQQVCPPSEMGLGKPSPDAVTQCLAQHGYTLWTGYQPASRFWPFQWIESGWLLALSVLLIAVTVWLVRRRAA